MLAGDPGNSCEAVDAALSLGAKAVVDRQFNESEPMGSATGYKFPPESLGEAPYASLQHSAEGFPAYQQERAGGISEPHMEEQAVDTSEQARHEKTGPRIASRIPISKHNVAIAGSIRIYETREIPRVALPIGIDASDQGTFGMTETIDHGSGIAFAFNCRDEPDGQPAHHRIQDRDGVIGRTILANDETDRDPAFEGDDSVEFLQGSSDGTAFIAYRKYDVNRVGQQLAHESS